MHYSRANPLAEVLHAVSCTSFGREGGGNVADRHRMNGNSLLRNHVHAHLVTLSFSSCIPFVAVEFVWINAIVLHLPRAITYPCSSYARGRISPGLGLAYPQLGCLTGPKQTNLVGARRWDLVSRVQVRRQETAP